MMGSITAITVALPELAVDSKAKYQIVFFYVGNCPYGSS
jgi:hypothetical protein